MRAKQGLMRDGDRRYESGIGKVDYILVVNGDPIMREAVITHFSDNNFSTSSASSWSELKCTGTPPTLIIMDEQLRQNEGRDQLRSIRSHSDIPVIITGNRADEVDRIVSLELGADDYIARPSPRELLARTRAILRRREIGRVARTRDSEGGYRFNGWRLERRERRLVDARQIQVSLSKGEYALLLAFLEAPQRPLSREHLLQATRVREDIFDRSIDVQVLRLRRKLEVDPTAQRVILTERGIGYVFAPHVESF
jgi:two-component system OmpR family response regulator